MVPSTHMNIEDKVHRYTERGFQKVEAEILVLIEESAAAIFKSFPGNFILFGGAAPCALPRQPAPIPRLGNVSV